MSFNFAELWAHMPLLGKIIFFGLCLMGVGFVGLVIAHIYFALRPEKLWITKAMIFGTISRREYLEYHDPDRWVADKSGSN